ncbi:hypothetical protein [Olivibacter ginsenosidimutans]
MLCLFLTVVVFTFQSCKKEETGSGNTEEQFLGCKINGKSYTFNAHVNANDRPSEEVVHFVVISGWENEDTATSPGFGIDLVLPEGAEEETYSVAGGSTSELDGQYYIQNFKDGKHIGTTVYDGGRTDGTKFTLTITSLTDWGVKGTFSGVLKLVGGSEYLTVTDGEFSAPYN